MLQASKMVGKVRLCTEKYTKRTENEMILVIRNLTMLDLHSAAVLVLVGETIRILVGAGTEAIKNGIHSGRLASELATVVGGSGGGKDYFGQGGGTKIDAADEVLKRAESAVKAMVTK